MRWLRPDQSMSAKHTLMTTLPVFLRGAEVLSIVLSYDFARVFTTPTFVAKIQE
ncbi:hypothetical protein J6590_098559, partial [Homalodisca vitripennis]